MLGERMRLVLGCFRIPGDRFRATIDAALAGGVDRFDTARAYRDNEANLAFALDGRAASIVTKCGMREGWVPDGRAKAILDDARASHAALHRPADLLLLHAPDPKTPLATSVRALVEARDAGHALALGLSNVSLRELDAAMRIAPISAVEVALGGYDDAPAKSGLVRACGEREVEVLAYSVFGGPKRSARFVRDPVLVAIARRLEASPACVFLAYLRAVHPSITPIVGVSRPETVADLADVALDDDALAMLDRRFPGLGRLRVPPPIPSSRDREVVMIMGVPGAGKSRLAQTLGGTRLNRDEMGGTLRRVASAIERHLRAGERRLVVDNTYVTRATRSDVLAAAHQNGARVRCVFLDTPRQEAEINVVLRMLAKTGRLLAGEELLRAQRKDPNLLAPLALFKMTKQLEPPSLEEGFAEVDVVPFVRDPWRASEVGAAIAAELVLDASLAPLPDARSVIAETEGHVVVLGWREGVASVREAADALAQNSGRDVEVAICPHAAGPPRCWCRPPLPGLFVEWAVRRGIDPKRSVFVGSGATFDAMARALGASVVPR